MFLPEMLSICARHITQKPVAMTRADFRGLSDPMAHLMGNLDHGSKGRPMVDQRGHGAMRSGPHLGLQPIVIMQKRQLILDWWLHVVKP